MKYPFIASIRHKKDQYFLCAFRINDKIYTGISPLLRKKKQYPSLFCFESKNHLFIMEHRIVDLRDEKFILLLWSNKSISEYQ